MHFVKEAVHLSGYRLLLVFEDGRKRIADLGPHLDGEAFAPLKNPAYFKTFRVHPELGTVVWPSGAAFSPDFLHKIGSWVAEAGDTAGRRP